MSTPAFAVADGIHASRLGDPANYAEEIYAEGWHVLIDPGQ